MKCPNCGALEQARVRVCQHCGTAYSSEDLMELRQLEFLLAETAAWPDVGVRRQRYAERLAALKGRVLPAPLPPAPLPAAATPPPAPAAKPAAPPPSPVVVPRARQVQPGLAAAAAASAAVHQQVPAPQPKPGAQPRCGASRSAASGPTGQAAGGTDPGSSGAPTGSL